MKEYFWTGISWLVIAVPALAQSMEQLPRQLADQTAENAQLRSRITIL